MPCSSWTTERRPRRARARSREAPAALLGARLARRARAEDLLLGDEHDAIGGEREPAPSGPVSTARRAAARREELVGRPGARERCAESRGRAAAPASRSACVRVGRDDARRGCRRRSQRASDRAAARRVELARSLARRARACSSARRVVCGSDSTGRAADASSPVDARRPRRRAARAGARAASAAAASSSPSTKSRPAAPADARRGGRRPPRAAASPRRRASSITASGSSTTHSASRRAGSRTSDTMPAWNAGRQRLDAEEQLPLLDLLEQAARLRRRVARRRRRRPGCSRARIGARRSAIVSRTGCRWTLVQRAQRALRRRVVEPDRLDVVAEQLDADGMAVERREEIDDPAAHRERPGVLDHRRRARTRRAAAPRSVASRSSVGSTAITSHSASNGARGMTRRNSAAADATSTVGAKPLRQPEQRRHPPQRSCAGRAACRRTATNRGAGSSSTGGGASGSSPRGRRAKSDGVDEVAGVEKNSRSLARVSAVSSSGTT